MPATEENRRGLRGQALEGSRGPAGSGRFAIYLSNQAQGSGREFRGGVARLFSARVDRVAESRCTGSEPGGRPPDRDGRAGEQMAARHGATSPDVKGHSWIPRRAIATPVTRGGRGSPA